MENEISEYVDLSVSAYEVTQIISLAVSFGYELHRVGVDTENMSKEDTLVVNDFIENNSSQVIKIVGDTVNKKWEQVLKDVGLQEVKRKRWWEVWK